MKYLTPILLGVSSLLGVASLIVTSFTVSSFEENKASISQNLTKIEKLKEEMKEARALDHSKLARERRRNQELEDELKGKKQEFQLISEGLEGTREELKDLAVSIEDAENSLKKIQETIVLAREELESSKTSVFELESELPQIRSKISEAMNNSADLDRQKQDHESRMAGYPEVTDLLRDHYRRILKAMRKYELERPWLEKGESLSLKFESIDFESGLVTLPIGTEKGVKTKMAFAVQKNGKELCKIRITRAKRYFSLAEIIPMVGFPLHLQDFEKFDLVVL